MRVPLSVEETVKSFLSWFEHAVVFALLAMMVFVVFLTTIELGVVLVQEMIRPPFLLLNIEEMLTVFGFFLMVLIGVELMETIKIYLDRRTVHVDVIIMVAVIAMARKVIILDLKEMDAGSLFGVAAIILALALGFYAIRKVPPRQDE
ncbi:MAG: phosphate-starvation-inducible E-like protein [Candidatus Abyssobacteria bacterium SURF_5]|uniref:Phosphate-starvation-inducible E-like protein n=1 Tax=Abyssobacteria bacterium (strain SURF_5) TaxID=2093360 RepID=A0A3A4NPH1_ABYX5|nr:MAG: phosphate-starvation-inducible E-like protein [Candidatus Abyssubacteria bacterium SURF_5]